METLFLNITITAVAYLFIPIILCLTKKQFTLSKIKKITIINGISIWLIFAIININAGGNGVSATVFLWSAVAYCLLKKKCLIHSDNTNDSNPDVLIPDNSTTTIPPLETKNIPSSYKNKIFSIRSVLNVIVSIMLVISLAFNIYLYTPKDENVKYIYTDKYEMYFTYWQNTHTKLEFIDNNIVFIEDDGTDLYHKYDCHKFIGSTYWAHNIDYAEYIGYSPCPICHN